MVNLLGRRAADGRFLCLDADPHGPVEARLVVLAELLHRDRLRWLGGTVDRLEVELEELASSPSRVTALALLEAIDGLRRAACDGPSSNRVASSPRSAFHFAAGDYVCHRPGRSLATGEAEIASRGYFDVLDRPPIACWIGILSPQSARSSDDDGDSIVAWIAPDDLERARAGCEACRSGALRMLVDLAPEAHRQLRSLESVVWPDAHR